MNSISANVANTIYSASVSVLRDNLDVDQTISDSYKDDRKRYVKREFFIKSKPYKDHYELCFEMVETYATSKEFRIHFDNITLVEMTSLDVKVPKLTLKAGAYSISFEIQDGETTI